MNEWDIIIWSFSVCCICAASASHRRKLFIINFSFAKIAVHSVVGTDEDVIVQIAHSLVEIGFQLCIAVKLFTEYFINADILVRKNFHPIA